MVKQFGNNSNSLSSYSQRNVSRKLPGPAHRSHNAARGRLVPPPKTHGSNEEIRVSRYRVKHGEMVRPILSAPFPSAFPSFPRSTPNRYSPSKQKRNADFACSINHGLYPRRYLMTTMRRPCDVPPIRTKTESAYADRSTPCNFP